MTIQLRAVGFFRELPHGLPDGPRLRDHVSRSAAADESQIVGYLRAGRLLIATPGVARDVMDPDGALAVPPNILTDGVWAWPADLQFYVEKYHARLPDEFVQHMRVNGWSVPDVDTAQLEFSPS